MILPPIIYLYNFSQNTLIKLCKLQQMSGFGFNVTKHYIKVVSQISSYYYMHSRYLALNEEVGRGRKTNMLTLSFALR